MKFPNFGKRNELASELAVGHAVEPTNEEANGEKHRPDTSSGERDAGSSDDEHVLNTKVEAGVKKIEAVTLTWTKNELILAYALYVPSLNYKVVELTPSQCLLGLLRHIHAAADTIQLELLRHFFVLGIAIDGDYRHCLERCRWCS